MEATNTEIKNEEVNENQTKMGFKEKFVSLVEANPGIMIPIITGFTMLVRGIFGAIFDTESRNYRNCQVRDDVTELNYLVKHPLTNSEILELSARKESGESTGVALDNMGVLRKEKRRK